MNPGIAAFAGDDDTVIVVRVVSPDGDPFTFGCSGGPGLSPLVLF